jgi:ADP-ribose pyrophosphatase YjhB (NUDIX family)
MTAEAGRIVGVAGVIRDGEGRILLIRTERVGWEMPGGRVEYGEDFLAALEREAMEETGCSVEVGRLTGVTSDVDAPGLVLFTFLCRYTGGEPHAGDDSLEVGWFSPDAAVEAVTHPVERLRLQDALSEAPEVVYRAYRRLSPAGQRGDRFEMLRLHPCSR